MNKNWDDIIKAGKLLAIGTLVGVLISGCSGGSSGSTSPAVTATGQFKDSNTSGLSYVSGGQTGVTGADGGFTYEVGQPVTFKVGGLTVGSVSAGKSIVTPIDLVTAGTSSLLDVQNRVRLLMMLDSDADATNGITISAAVQSAAANWTTPDFSLGETAFTTAVSGIQNTVNLADSRTSSLTTASAAQAHLEATLRCAYAGAYKGTFAGADTGRYGVLVDALTGMVSGFAYSNAAASTFTLAGSTAISYDQDAAFTSGSASNSSTFAGKYTSVNGLSGTWSNTSVIPAATGTFTGARVGGSSNAKHRYTGAFTGAANGLFSIDVDANNNIVGTGYNFTSDNEFALAGTVSAGGVLSLTSGTTGTITGTLNTATGALSGNWSDSGDSGTFTGSGCTLN